eukprot:TRINITY_DN5177_c0_g1_i1.p1 TRINITY_DN5177_c0_g1~~TRINITY_DN5177_c0_g1_i1.p1  ORF type:complete len:241 (-),score=58.58 TRINITY_DN5177_c0_g1_i1:19-741(-)
MNELSLALSILQNYVMVKEVCQSDSMFPFPDFNRTDIDDTSAAAVINWVTEAPEPETSSDNYFPDYLDLYHKIYSNRRWYRKPLRTKRASQIDCNFADRSLINELDFSSEDVMKLQEVCPVEVINYQLAANNITLRDELEELFKKNLDMIEAAEKVDELESDLESKKDTIAYLLKYRRLTEIQKLEKTLYYYRILTALIGVVFLLKLLHWLYLLRLDKKDKIRQIPVALVQRSLGSVQRV